MHEDATVVVTRDGWMKRVGEIKDPSATRVREGDARAGSCAATRAIALVALLELRRRLRDEGRRRAGDHRLRRAGAVAAQLQGRRAHHQRGAGRAAAASRGATRRRARKRRPGASCSERPARRTPGDRAPPPASATVLLSGAEQAPPVDRWLVATAGGMGFFCRPDLTETTRSGRRFARTKEGDELVGDGARRRRHDHRRQRRRQGTEPSPPTSCPSWPAPDAASSSCASTSDDRAGRRRLPPGRPPAARRRRRRQRASLHPTRGRAPGAEGAQGTETLQGRRPAGALDPRGAAQSAPAGLQRGENLAAGRPGADGAAPSRATLTLPTCVLSGPMSLQGQ